MVRRGIATRNRTRLVRQGAIRGVGPCYPCPMFWKLLLTAAVILGAYLVIRARMRRPPESVARAPAIGL